MAGALARRLWDIPHEAVCAGVREDLIAWEQTGAVFVAQQHRSAQARLRNGKPPEDRTSRMFEATLAPYPGIEHCANLIAMNHENMIGADKTIKLDLAKVM